jgi:hypothetical protein
MAPDVFFSLELKKLKKKFGKRQALKIGTVIWMDSDLDPKKESRK